MTHFRWLTDRLSRRCKGGDEGIAMLTVIAIGMILSIFIVALSARTLMVLNTSRSDRQREQAIQAADGGAQVMIRAALAGATYNVALPSDYATAFTTSYPSCERTWVLWAIKATANSTAPAGTCPSASTVWTKPVSTFNGSTSDGSYTVLYAADGTTDGVVYSVGTGAGATQHQRIVREEVIINSSSTFALTTAVYSNTDLTMTEGGAISGSAGNVHTNGVLNCCGGGKVSGNITGGSCAGGCSQAQSHSCQPVGQVPGCQQSASGVSPTVSLPPVSPRDYWPAADYALCPDGKVHLGPDYVGSFGTAPSSSVVPCSAGDPAIASTLNWGYGSGVWTYSSGSASTNGVYYAYQTDVKVSSGGQFNGSIVAEGSGTGCSLTGGTVTLTGGGGFVPDTANTKIGGFGVIADGPLTVTAGGPAFAGIFYTNQYFTMTGGGSNVNAAVVSNDLHSPACGLNKDTAGGSWNYNGDMSFTTNTAPSASSTSWLEL